MISKKDKITEAEAQQKLKQIGYSIDAIYWLIDEGKTEKIEIFTREIKKITQYLNKELKKLEVKVEKEEMKD